MVIDLTVPKGEHYFDWKTSPPKDPSSFYDDTIWRKIDHNQEKKLDWAKLFSIHSPAKSKKIISTLWVDALTSLEEILRNLRSNMSISELCDKLSVTLYEHIQKTTKKDS